LPTLIAPDPQRPVERGPVPSFSILIAAYQVAEYIGAAIESALAQTLPPHEIVVCDDGSTDDLDGALAPYVDRIVLVRQQNRGEGAAKNAAANAATGDFLVILDADDTYLPSRLAVLGEVAARRPDIDIFATDAWLEVGGRAVRRAYDETWSFEVGDQRRGILERNFILGHAAVRRERFLAVDGFDDSMRTVADWDLWMRMILDGSRAGFVPEPLARYRVRQGSLSTEQGPMLQGQLRCLEKARRLADLTPEEQATAAIAMARRRRELALVEAREALRDGRPDARRRLLRVAFGGGYGARTRLKAAASAAAPRRAGALLAERDGAGFVGAAGVRVDGDERAAERSS